MSFFFASAKAAEKVKPRPATHKRGTIPIQALNKLGCSVCPSDKRTKELRTPKMPAGGSSEPSVYLLTAAPDARQDREGSFEYGAAEEVVLSKFRRKFRDQELRHGHLVQCSPVQEFNESRGYSPEVVEIECCRPRVIADIERTKPLVVVGVGDAALTWATGLSGGSPTWRGRLIATKFGSHSCFFYPVMWPAFAFKDQRSGRKTEYELALEHDLAALQAWVLSQMLPPLETHSGPKYDEGIELITGQKAGDFQRLERALSDMISLPAIALDVETNGLRPYLKDPLLISAAVGTFDHTVAFAIDHPEGWGTATRRRVHGLFSEFLLYSGTKIAHNLAMEMEWLAYLYGSILLRRTEWADTMAMCHTLDERKGTKSLDSQCRVHYGFFLKPLSRVDVTRANWWTQYSIEEALRYNGLDTKWTHKLAGTLMREIMEEGPAQLEEYERKVRLAPTLVLTELKGLPADVGYAQVLADQFDKTVIDLEAKIRRTPEVKLYGQRFGQFSPSNSHDVLKLLKDVLKRPEVKRTNRDGTVSMSTDEDVLSLLPVSEVPSAALILEHRGVEKLRSTYLEPVISGKSLSHDGRLHSKYSSMTAETGRAAADDPNIQNWPKRKHKEIRGIVYAPPGQWMVAADYGQIEFRVVGMASEDSNLVKACWTGYDVHKFWAERMVALHPDIKRRIEQDFGIDWDEKGLKTLRQEAKNMWVFPMLFGSSLRSCGENLKLPDDVVEELGAEFWDTFPGVKKWQGRLLKAYEKNLYVETLGGRKRRGPLSPNQIINHPIQGTAADIVTEGMNALSVRAELEDDEETQPSLNVHDDLSTMVIDANLEKKIEVIAYEMCKPRFDYINVPLIVEVSIGTRWSDLEEIGKYSSAVLFNLVNPYE